MNNIYSADMTSIVPSMPTFSDLPIDIIIYILSLCECDITKEQHFLNFNTKKVREIGNYLLKKFDLLLI